MQKNVFATAIDLTRARKMTDHNQPADRKDARIYLRAKQVMLAELLLSVNENELKTISDLLGLIHSESDKLNEKLEEY